MHKSALYARGYRPQKIHHAVQYRVCLSTLHCVTHLKLTRRSMVSDNFYPQPGMRDRKYKQCTV